MSFFKSIAVSLVVACAGLVPSAFAQTAKPPVSFDLSALDKSVNPCTDFYQFACGGWRANNPIPGDKSRWGRFNELDEYNLSLLHNILETAAKPGKHSALEQKVGNFYSACMDEKTVDALGVKPLQPEFDRIAKISDKAGVMQQIAHMQQEGMSALFGFGSSTDMHDSNQMIASLGQGGLTLPDRDYYIKDDPKSKETREKYVEHVQKMFELAGEKPEQAASDAKNVLALETRLAQAAMDRVAMRDPKNRDHRMTVADLDKLAPNFGFPAYFVATGAPKFNDLNVSTPDYFKTISAQMVLK